MNGPAGNQERSEVYEHDDSLYAYAKFSQSSSWAEFAISGNYLVVTLKTAQSGVATDILRWGISKLSAFSGMLCLPEKFAVERINRKSNILNFFIEY